MVGHLVDAIGHCAADSVQVDGLVVRLADFPPFGDTERLQYGENVLFEVV